VPKKNGGAAVEMAPVNYEDAMALFAQKSEVEEQVKAKKRRMIAGPAGSKKQA